MSDSIVFGSVAKVNEYKRSKGIAIDQQPKNAVNRPKSNAESKAYVIGGDKDATVTDEEIALLDNVLIRNDPDVVYMQEDISFYDEYYLTDVKIDNALLEEARKIRRIYRNYSKYMYACYIRELYLEYIEKAYDIDTMLRYTSSDVVVIPRDVFIPPYPIYSKNAEDYQDVMNGNYSMDIVQSDPPSEEDLKELMTNIALYDDRDVDSIGWVPGGIETFRPALAVYGDGEINHSSKYSGPSSVSVTDLDALQKMIRSWHTKEETKIEQTRQRTPFPKSEQGIKDQYYNQLAYYIADHINDSNKEEDDNEMVYDEVTKKPMTRKERDRRKTLRMLSENSGWDMVKLMHQLNIGSKMERKILQNKSRNKKKAKKMASDFMSSVMGSNFDYDEQMVMSEDELREYLFSD